MIPDVLNPHTTAFLAALGASVILTPLVRAGATRAGHLAQPNDDRWHTRPVALLGGVAMFASFLIALLVVRSAGGALMPLVVYCGLMFMLGAADDVLRLGPSTKLAGQVVAAGVFIALAPSATLTGFLPLDLLVRFVWLVGIANAFNLLDNMDGLSAGVALIAAIFFLSIIVPAGQGPVALALAAFAGAVAGFLFYNFQPASIFMGDGGSFFLGAVLGSSTLLVAPDFHTQLLAVAAIPVLILLIPIFDTTFVTLTRGLAGRSALVGGRDHTSHRLVALGISERRAVLSLYVLAAAGGVVAVGVHRMGIASGIGMIGLYLTILLALGVVLSHVEAAQGAQSTRETPPLVADLTNRYRLYEVALDAALIAVAYYVAFRVRFQEPQFSGFLPQFLKSFPMVIACQVGGLWLAGKYRQVWRHFGSSELINIVRGIVYGAAAAVVVLLYLYRFEGFSRVVFLIDIVVLCFLLVASRVAIGTVDDYLRRERARGRRVLIYGAGRGGALLVRELLQNAEMGLNPVGFLDDDRSKRRVKVDGLPIVGGLRQLPVLIPRLGIEEVLVSVRDLAPGRMAELVEACRERRVSVRRMRFTLEDVEQKGPATIHVIHHGR